MISGVLLDLDGTLIDSNEAHALSWAQAIKESGIEVEVDSIRKLIGMGGDQLLPQLGIFPENEKFDLIQNRKTEIFSQDLLPSLKAFDGARELVERLQQKGVKIVVASSSSTEELQALLQQAGIEDLIKNTVSSDQAARSKPQPDIILAALEKAHLSSHEAILVGDTPYDIYAARRAGLNTIAFTCGGFTEQELLAALEIYDSPRHLLNRFKSSVLGQAKRAAA